MPDPGELHRAMLDELTERGELSSDWEDAFAAVPRHVFLPDTVWWQDEKIDGAVDLVPLHRGEEPEAWIAMAYSNQAVIIQVDDGVPVGPGLRGYDITSSASMPTMVAVMLGKLQAQPGMSVLEIGTGTGYNAALLAHRLGQRAVTTVEIDAALADHARKVLVDAGYGDVAVITADGAEGYVPRAPYDRVLSTAAVREVPYPWIAQTRPGGLVVTPWGSDYYNGNLLALSVDDHGVGVGRIIEEAAFMRLRSQRSFRGWVSRDVYDEDHAVESTTELHPYDVAGTRGASTAIGLRVPSCRYLYHSTEDNDGDDAVLWLLDSSSRSWAALYHRPDQYGPYRVRQLGSRRLWDEVEAAYRWWAEQDQPSVDRWLITVDAAGQRVTLV
jgi:protein-L-isoaspartate(D-aspartate) O-methyltransferase